MVLFQEIEIPESAGSASSSKRRSEHTDKTNKSGSSSWISWSTGRTEESAKSRESQLSRSTSVIFGRGVFVFFLLVVAIVLALLARFLLSRAEHNLMVEQYTSMMARALDVTRALAVSKNVNGLRSM